MKIVIDKNKLEEALTRVEMKGKYYDGNKAKNSILSNYAYCLVDSKMQDKLYMYNGDLTTACGMFFDISLVDEITEKKSFILDIEKTKNYLSPFDDEITLDVGDYLTISDGIDSAKLPLVVEHPSRDMVKLISSRFTPIVSSTSFGDDATLEMITFGKTEYDGAFTVLSSVLTEAMKACDVVDLARYKITMQSDTAHIDSTRSPTDTFQAELNMVSSIGDGAIMEFTGDIVKFLKGEKYVNMHLKDDSPLIIATESAMLVKAPYLQR